MKGILLLMAAVAAFGLYLHSRDDGRPAPRAAAAVTAPMPVKQVKIEKMNWHRDGFGNVAVGSFTIANGNIGAVHDVTMLCMVSAPSGTILDIKRVTIYKSVPGMGCVHVVDHNFGFIDQQARAMNCEPLELGK